MYKAAREENLEEIRLLLKKGADIEEATTFSAAEKLKDPVEVKLFIPYFEFETDTGTITDYKVEAAREELGEEKALNVIIPAEVEGVKVVKIQGASIQICIQKVNSSIIPFSYDDIVNVKEAAFYNKGLTSVKIPDSVKEVGVIAFSDNSLQPLELGDSIEKIGMSAFKNNEKTSVEIT